MMTHDDRGEGGVKNCQNGGDVICGFPLVVFFFVKSQKITTTFPTHRCIYICFTIFSILAHL